MKLKPFVQWAGGKRQLLKHLVPLVPAEYNVYHEPFLGGGAMLFELQPKKAIVNDSNKELINCYKQIKENCEDVCKVITRLEQFENNSDNYQSMRADFNGKLSNQEYDAETAGLMLVLNKRCFNGLHRVNSKGLFNSPWGRNIKIPAKNDLQNLHGIADYLNDNNVRVFCTDFTNICNMIQTNDFVFFDSPYVPLSETANFDRYTKDKFAENEHKTLANIYKMLDNRGVKQILTNHNTPLTRELYKDYNIREVVVQRSINADVKKRVGKEIIITNF